MSKKYWASVRGGKFVGIKEIAAKDSSIHAIQSHSMQANLLFRILKFFRI